LSTALEIEASVAREPFGLVAGFLHFFQRAVELQGKVFVVAVFVLRKEGDAAHEVRRLVGLHGNRHERFVRIGVVGLGANKGGSEEENGNGSNGEKFEQHVHLDCTSDASPPRPKFAGKAPFTLSKIWPPAHEVYAFYTALK
jgi:hypothetical protein